jgi:hypothetical protein
MSVSCLSLSLLAKVKQSWCDLITQVNQVSSSSRSEEKSVLVKKKRDPDRFSASSGDRWCGEEDSIIA